MSLSVLGDYNIIKQIGQGSLGRLFLAEHRFMKKQYAIKVLPESIVADRNFINRFHEQIAILSSLEHPSIVKMYNVSFSDGLYFLVCDCVVDDLGESTNLFQYLSEHKSFGETEDKAGEYAEDLAASMLATTLGLEFDPDAAWDEREQIYKASGKIIRTSNITQSAIGNKDGLWTTVLSAAVFVPRAGENNFENNI